MTLDEALNILEPKALFPPEFNEAISVVKEECKALMENGNLTGLELAQIAAMQMMLKKYVAIGTPEECMAAVEKQNAKKPKEFEDKFYGCPVCGNVLLHKWEKYPAKLMDKKNGLPYCLGCGQRILWEV